MAVFGVETDADTSVIKFMKESHDRLQSNNIVDNPFNGRIIRAKDNNTKKYTYVVIMQPIYPKIYLIGLFYIGIALLFTGMRLSLWQLPGIILYATGIFWSKIFIYSGLKMGLRKYGYRGKVRLLSATATLERVIL